MYKIMMSGEIDALSTTASLDDALAIIMTAVFHPEVSGHLEDCESGEVLVVLENGEVTYVAPDTVIKMLDDIYESDPEMALVLALMGLVAFSEEVPEPAPTEEEIIAKNLLEILGKL